MIQLAPYLNFKNKGGEALTFYHSVLGGDLTLQTYGDSGQAKDDSEKNLLMHGELKTADFVIYAADGGDHNPVSFGTNAQLSIMGDDEATLTEYFNKLSEGGNVDMPLAKQFWGDTFGMLTDKFGQHWMVNISAKKQEA